MKGTFFAKPLEYKINISGESWTQGSTVSGELTIINHGSENIDLTKVGCHLCYCTSKKFKSKDASAITLIKSELMKEGSNEMPFKFKLDESCPITENAGSLYIICGDINDPFNGGILELKVAPTNAITDFVQTFEQYFRFKLKSFKNKKEYIEASVTAPDSPTWKSIQKMSLQMKMNGDDLNVNFVFNLKKLSFEDTSKTKDEKQEFNKLLTKKDYSLYGSVNHDVIKKVITEVLDEVKVKPIL